MVEQTNVQDQVQPVDGYVMSLLRTANENYGVQVDLNAPTRAQRLEAALAMKGELNGSLSIEIMVGRRIASDETTYHFLLLTQGMFPQEPRKFYDDFAHDYCP